MKKYPYIGQFEEGIVTLFTSHESGFVLENPSKYKTEFSRHWDEITFTNVTHEYLQNSWGVVESKEHAEFIIELAALHGINVFNGFSDGITHFMIVDSEVIFINVVPTVDEHAKQITIPLPPKCARGEEIIAYPKEVQAVEILSSLDYHFDEEKKQWFTKNYIQL